MVSAERKLWVDALPGVYGAMLRLAIYLFDEPFP